MQLTQITAKEAKELLFDNKEIACLNTGESTNMFDLELSYLNNESVCRAMVLLDNEDNLFYLREKDGLRPS